MKRNASSGFDGIKVKLMKTLKTTLIPIIAKIINNNIMKGKFPNELR